MSESVKVDRGASLVEYALLVSLIAAVCLLAVQVMGQKVSQRYSYSVSSIA